MDELISSSLAQVEGKDRAVIDRLNRSVLGVTLHQRDGGEDAGRNYAVHVWKALDLAEEMPDKVSMEDAARDVESVLKALEGADREVADRVVEEMDLECTPALVSGMWIGGEDAEDSGTSGRRRTDLFDGCRELLHVFCRRGSAREMYTALVDTFVSADVEEYTSWTYPTSEMVELFAIVLARIERKRALFFDHVVEICVRAIDHEPDSQTNRVPRLFQSIVSFCRSLHRPEHPAEHAWLRALVAKTYVASLERRVVKRLKDGQLTLPDGDAFERHLRDCLSLAMQLGHATWDPGPYPALDAERGGESSSSSSTAAKVATNQEAREDGLTSACLAFGQLVPSAASPAPPAGLEENFPPLELFTAPEAVFRASPHACALLRSSRTSLRIAGAQLVHVILDRVSSLHGEVFVPSVDDMTDRRYASLVQLGVLLGDHACTCDIQEQRTYALNAFERLVQISCSDHERLLLLRDVLQETNHTMLAAAIITRIKDLLKEASSSEYDEAASIVLQWVLPRYLRPHKDFLFQLDVILSAANLSIFVALSDRQMGLSAGRLGKERTSFMKTYVSTAKATLGALGRLTERDHDLARHAQKVKEDAMRAEEEEEEDGERDPGDRNDEMPRARRKHSARLHPDFMFQMAGKSFTDVLLAHSVVDHALTVLNTVADTGTGTDLNETSSPRTPTLELTDNRTG